MSDTLDDLQWLTDLDGGDVAPTSLAMERAGAELAAVMAAASISTVPTHRRRQRRWAGGGLVGIAAIGLAVVLLAGPDLPGGLGSEPASAQEQLRRIADRAESTPFPAYPFSSETHEEQTFDPPRADRFTWRDCTTITLSATDAAVRCEADAADPTPPMLYQGNPAVGEIAAARTPEEITRNVDEFVADMTTEADWSGEPSDPTELRTVGIGLTLSSYTLEPELRATLLRLLADIPGLRSEPDARTTTGTVGTRFTVDGAHGGWWAITVDPSDGFVLELRASALLTPEKVTALTQSMAIDRPTHLDALPDPVATLSDRLAALPPDPAPEAPGTHVGGPGRSLDCVAADPAAGPDIDGWTAQRCVQRIG